MATRVDETAAPVLPVSRPRRPQKTNVAKRRLGSDLVSNHSASSHAECESESREREHACVGTV